MAGPSVSCPRASTDRFSTSPLRKSACVAAWKNFDDDARTVPAASAMDRAQIIRRRVRGTLIRRDDNGNSARSVDGVVSGQLPFTERCIAERAEAPGAAVSLEYPENRRGKRGERFAADDGAWIGAEQLDIQRAPATAPVQHPDHLGHIAGLR